MIVALTGGIGSGKSEASKIFASLGVPVVDTDIISHQLTAKGQPTLQKIITTFGDGFLTNDGELDRKALRELVFSNQQALEKLEAILHPAIYQRAKALLAENATAPYQILAIPLLSANSRYMNDIQRVLVIDCDEETQIQRTVTRSKLTRDEVRAIMQSQMNRENRLKLANDIVSNDGNLQDFCEKITDLHKKYLNTCIVSK